MGTPGELDGRRAGRPHAAVPEAPGGPIRSAPGPFSDPPDEHEGDGWSIPGGRGAAARPDGLFRGGPERPTATGRRGRHAGPPVEGAGRRASPAPAWPQAPPGRDAGGPRDVTRTRPTGPHSVPGGGGSHGPGTPPLGASGADRAGPPRGTSGGARQAIRRGDEAGGPRGIAERPAAGRRPDDGPAGASGGRRGSRGPIHGYPPLPGQPDPVYPQKQFSLWNRQSVRAAWLGLPAGEERPHSDSDPGYAVLAVSESSADATSTQTWAAIDDTGEWPASRPGQRRSFTSDHGSYPGQRPPAGWPGDLPGGPRPAGRMGAGRDGRPLDAAAPIGQAGRRAREGRAAPEAFGAAGEALAASAAPGAAGSRPSAGSRGTRPGAAGLGAVQSRTGASGAGGAGFAGTGMPAPGGSAAASSSRSLAGAGRPRTGRGRRGAGPSRLLLALLVAPVAIVVVVVAGVVYVNSRQAARPPHSAASPAVRPSTPAPTLGPWKHIDSRAGDPAPLTLAELFPARIAAGARTTDKAGAYCPRAVIGSALRAAVRKASCTQVMRASYLSANRKMMATVGVLNLSTASAAERVGRATGATEFISQLPGPRGPTKNLAKGTGLEVAEVKGHYLILIWAEFANLRAPSGKRQRAELLSFSNALITDTVNVSLSSRMVTGQPTSP